jgi:hypothetical protein
LVDESTEPTQQPTPPEEAERELHQETIPNPDTCKIPCTHPSFAIVKHPEGDYSLHCYDCREDLPFFFYTEQEWAEEGKVKAVKS